MKEQILVRKREVSERRLVSVIKDGFVSTLGQFCTSRLMVLLVILGSLTFLSSCKDDGDDLKSIAGTYKVISVEEGSLLDTHWIITTNIQLIKKMVFSRITVA